MNPKGSSQGKGQPRKLSRSRRPRVPRYRLLRGRDRDVREGGSRSEFVHSGQDQPFQNNQAFLYVRIRKNAEVRPGDRATGLTN